MKIVFNSESDGLINNMIQIALEESKTDIVAAKSEKILFNEIGKENIDAFILQGHKNYTQRGIDFIKRKTPYIPVIVMIVNRDSIWPSNGDFYMFNYDLNITPEHLYKALSKTIISYNTNFEKLKRITAKIAKEVSFGECRYDPSRRTLHHKDKYIKKMAPKEGGVLEILASNFGSVIRKDIILEKVWHKTSFYTGRSLDVYLTNLRGLFKKEEIPLIINSIPGMGLILEHE